jgi:predicted branched-subunit amino acid permease
VGGGERKGFGMAATRMTEPRASFVKASLWMIGLSILLFWLPIIGPIVAGLIGGYFAGTVGRAILASLMPAVVLAVLILLVGTAFDLPVVGALASGAIGLVILFGDVPLVLAAIVGAVISQRR